MEISTFVSDNSKHKIRYLVLNALILLSIRHFLQFLSYRNENKMRLVDFEAEDYRITSNKFKFHQL